LVAGSAPRLFVARLAGCPDQVRLCLISAPERGHFRLTADRPGRRAWRAAPSCG